MAEHWRMDLNNYLQQNGLLGLVQWDQRQCGPQNAPTWTVYVYFQGVEYGRGSATNLGGARELAAERALKTLWSQRGY